MHYKSIYIKYNLQYRSVNHLKINKNCAVLINCFKLHKTAVYLN